jgi:hypothetical protein
VVCDEVQINVRSVDPHLWSLVIDECAILQYHWIGVVCDEAQINVQPFLLFSVCVWFI